MASEDLVVNRVHSSSTTTPGRALNQVRTHQLVIDEPTHLGGPGEEITPAEAFLAGVSACGVLLVQGRARDNRSRRPLQTPLTALQGGRGRDHGRRQDRNHR